MNKISVYGGTGFIGSAFCEKYKNEVLLIKKTSYEPLSNNILYFIGTNSNQGIFGDLNLDVDTNLKILLKVLSHCKNENIIFNFISTAFVYGNNVLNAKETEECNPLGFYSVTKRCAEQLLVTFCNTFNVKYRILRLNGVYGLSNNVEHKKNFFDYAINNLKNNKDIGLYDNGMYLKDYIHIEDACRAIKLILSNGSLNDIYNISYGNPFILRDTLEKIKIEYNSKSTISNVNIPKNQELLHSKNMVLNIDKLKNLGFTPNISLNTGIKLFF